MSADELPEEEVLIRAITDRLYDERKGRYSSEVFGKPRTSVSRLAILGYDDIVRIFCSDLHRPPDSTLLGYVEISVGALKEYGRNFESNGKPDRRQIIVEAKPVFKEIGMLDNPAHAEIKDGLPRSMNKEILRALKMTSVECK